MCMLSRDVKNVHCECVCRTLTCDDMPSSTHASVCGVFDWLCRPLEKGTHRWVHSSAATHGVLHFPAMIL